MQDVIPARLEWIEIDQQSVKITSSGDWKVNYLNAVIPRLKLLKSQYQNISVIWDVSSVRKIDTAGMLLVTEMVETLKTRHCEIKISGGSDEFNELYSLLGKYRSKSTSSKPEAPFFLLRLLEATGKNSVEFLQNIFAFISFIGENFIQLLHYLRYPGSIRFKAIVKNIEDAGLRAVPIITLTSFLIGVVIAYQGAVQLEKFGANIFIVDMIGISVTRELAPLITAIVVAGRTGSSYTAQLGVMKLTEEIDAMKTMGFEPHRFLVLPRIIALMIALPLLIFFADIIGILGGMVISNLHLHLSFSEFLHRLQNVLAVKHVWIGLIKGPFFAWLIASVGCFNGFQVSKDTESIGRFTTISVVNAIFLVIACDAIFSVVLTELGL